MHTDKVSGANDDESNAIMYNNNMEDEVALALADCVVKLSVECM